MDEEKKPQFLNPIIIAVCVLAAFALFYFGMQYVANSDSAQTPSEATPAPAEATPTPASQTPDETPDPTPEHTLSPQKELSVEEAMNICQLAATKHLGEGTMIMPDFEGALTEVTFDGKTRPCYVFIGGGIEYFLSSAAGDPPARYVVDVTTGDVFDTISKKYIR